MTSSNRPLSAMLSQVLIAYTVDFDASLAEVCDRLGQTAPPSLAMWANVLRFIGERGVASRELPRLSGIAKPVIKSMLDCLERHGWIEIDGSGAVHFTARGAAAQRGYNDAHLTVQRRWQAFFGPEKLAVLRAALEDATGRLGTEFPEYPMPAPHRGAHPTGK